MNEIQIVVETDGKVKFVYSDIMSEFLKQGEARIERASHVEPELNGTWSVQMSPIGGPKLEGFSLRQEALDAEVFYINNVYLLNKKVKYIYGLINTDGQIFYVGATINVFNRLATHKYRGLKFVSYKILEIVEHSIWQEREKYWIACGRENDWPLINITNGGQGGNGVRNVGFNHTNETKLKISETTKAGMSNDEIRSKLSQSHLGKKHSKETRQKISEANFRRWKLYRQNL